MKMNEDMCSLWVPALIPPEARFELEVVLSSPLDEHNYELLARPLEVFTRAANCGSFVVPHEHSVQSHMTCTRHPLRQRFSCKWDISLRAIDRRAFQLLRGLLGRLEALNIGVSRIVLTDLALNDQELVKLPEPTDENETEVYPDITLARRFQIEREPLEFSKARRCLVETKLPLDGWHVQTMGECMNAWYALLEGGAYALPIGHPSEIICIRGAVALFDEVTVEISVDRFIASEFAWSSAVNIIHAFSMTVVPVVKVTID